MEIHDRPAQEENYEEENRQIAERQATISSYWPISVAFGLLLIAVGVVSTLIISAVGVLILLSSIVGWVEENRHEQEPE
ncbi:MAG: cytochrome c oxidase subunit 4 [Chloroflexota bacterium]